MSANIVRVAREPDWLHTVTAILDAGGTVVYPTDTTYALGGDALEDDSVRKVLDIKGPSPEGFALTVCVGSIEDIRHVARLTPLGRRLAQRFFPGPLTLVLPALGTTAENLLGRHETVGVRVPDHPVARELTAHFGPLTATTAAFHGKPAPRTVDEARAELGSLVDLYVDAGPLPGRVSTIVDATGSEARIIRGGAIPESDLVGTHG